MINVTLKGELSVMCTALRKKESWKSALLGLIFEALKNLSWYVSCVVLVRNIY